MRTQDFMVDGFRLSIVCNENVIVGEGEEGVNFNKIILLNQSAAYLWKLVEGKKFTTDDLSMSLFERYTIDA